ncbi:hypothetical protein OEZ85_009494 [Tetradesmus obliquus]|uniref:Uncharacterized protein n=1 Tax=Tetradesmus obliquus TaxID=3088 RepID=A0ABY8U958_TETOB|nr:hypothetical protein OEZ85_009494 [Tetradesmus obliquus]
MAGDTVLCNWCGKEADPGDDSCFALSCSANCHAPKESDLYHDKCLKSYLRGMPGKNYDPSRKSGFPCPRGYGPKAATAVCRGKIMHMGKALVKAAKPAPPPPQPVRAPPPPRAAKAAKPPKAAQQQPAAAPKPKPAVQQQQQQRQQLSPSPLCREL